jgi:hypothetical protein
MENTRTKYTYGYYGTAVEVFQSLDTGVDEDPQSKVIADILVEGLKSIQALPHKPAATRCQGRAEKPPLNAGSLSHELEFRYIPGQPFPNASTESTQLFDGLVSAFDRGMNEEWTKEDAESAEQTLSL